ncbi:MAG: response regulator transcription factor, partial [Terrimonas sp.]|nr:response regulator transcription factor [Terrimonas sp.]
MIKTIIVDDEPKGRLALQEKIKAYCPTVEIVGQAGNGLEAITLIDNLKPELLFLDIEMPQMNGFEMLRKLKEKNFFIIFTTAYDQYAIQAIKYAAFDYLLKPIDIEELKTAVNKIKTTSENQFIAQLKLLQENLALPVKKLHKLAIPSLESILFLEIHHIIHLEANSNYTNIYMADKTKIIASKTLKEFSELLPADIFFRTHHSHIINLNFIKDILKAMAVRLS